MREFKIYQCPITIPLTPIVHTWIVTVWSNWETHRYEMHMFKNNNKKLWYLYIDDDNQENWLPIFPWIYKFKFKGKILYETKWGDWSLAYKLVNFTNNNVLKYKYKFNYKHLWPNCNSFTKRVISHFPEIQVKYPWNALWKNFKFD